MATQSLENDLSAALSRHLQKHFEAERCVPPPHLIESIRYSLLAPGKRIRPRLLLACAETLGLSRDAALPPALALEMTHCFTLIHDDLPCMDDDDFRRGMPSNHKKFGEATALLAGDALIAVALDTFLDCASYVGQRELVEALRRFNWAMGPRGVIGGQAAEETLGQGSSLSDLRQMHAGKTGALFEAAILIPKDLLGIPDSSVEGRALTRFASELGLAFQVMDDLDDQETDPTSVLFYVSAEEARQSTLQSLSNAVSELESQWPGRASSLTRIATEVSSKLETLAPGASG